MEEKYYTVTARSGDCKECLKHDLTCCTEGLASIPDRECSCVDVKKYSKYRSTYLLTEQEAEELKKDERVKSINLDIKYYDDLKSIAVPCDDIVKNRYNDSDYPIYSVQGISDVITELDEQGFQIFSEDWDSNEDYYNLNTNQLYRLHQKENPWVKNGLAATDKIEHTNINPIYHKGAGEDVDLIIVDDGVWFGNVEFNENVVNGKYPRDYRRGNALRQVPKSGGVNATCNILDICLDAPALIDPDFFYGDLIEERTFVRWDGTRIPTSSAAIDWWRNDNLNYRSAKFVSPENGGTATGDNDFGEIDLTNYSFYYGLGEEDFNGSGLPAGEQPRGLTNGTESMRSLFGDHGTPVASLAYGRTMGMAYNANKWAIRLFGGGAQNAESTLDAITVFHKLKPTPSYKNEKNPTIANCSWFNYGSFWQASVNKIEGKYFTWRGETSLIERDTENEVEAPSNPFERSLIWKDNAYLTAMNSYSRELADNSLTAAGDEAVEAGVFFVVASGNFNSNIVKPDHPNFNNFIHEDENAIFPGPLELSPGTIDEYYNTTSRRGFPMQIGKTEDYEYPAVAVGALDDSLYNGKEIRAYYSSNGNGIDLWAPADGTMAASKELGLGEYPDDYPEPFVVGPNLKVRLDDKLPYPNSQVSLNRQFGGTSAGCPVAAGFLTTLIAHHRDWDWRDLKKWINEELDGQPKDQFYNEGGDPDSPDDPAWGFMPDNYMTIAAWYIDYPNIPGSINPFLPDGELPKIPYVGANFLTTSSIINNNMAKPNSRENLIEYCLRSLGAPVIEINVDEDQVEDRIDEAIQFYREYHSDAIVRVYRKHQVSTIDIENGFITLPDSLLFVNRIFPFNRTSSGTDMFSVDYQIHLNDIYDLQHAEGLVHYEMTKQYLSLIDRQVNGMQQLATFSRHQNRLYIEGDWTTRIAAGEYIIVEGYESIDPDTYTDIYNDRFLKKYATALIKRQWGLNLIKFEGMQLPGGVTLNGRQIYDDAVQDIEKIEEEMQLTYEMPPDFFTG